MSGQCRTGRNAFVGNVSGAELGEGVGERVVFERLPWKRWGQVGQGLVKFAAPAFNLLVALSKKSFLSLPFGH